MTRIPTPEPTRASRLYGWLAAGRRFCLGTWPGRLMLAGAALKGATLGLWAAGLGGVSGVQGVSSLGGVALVVGAGILLVRLWRTARTQLLWRVRRKLIISYVFIGVVPAILIVTFFFLSGLLLFANLSSYLIRASLTDLADEAMAVARLAAVEIESRDSLPAVERAHVSRLRRVHQVPHGEHPSPAGAQRGVDARPGRPVRHRQLVRAGQLVVGDPVAGEHHRVSGLQYPLRQVGDSLV